MYQVFINQSSITFQHFDSLSDRLKNYLYINYSDLSELEEAVDLLKNSKNAQHLVFLMKEVEFQWELFKRQFEIVEASGGIVFNPLNEMLFIYRLGKWDLPKGKVEKGESYDDAAIREVEEECGLVDVLLEEKLMTTYHVYWVNDHQILKPTHWFKMRVERDQLLTPQEEEGIEQVCWVAPIGMEPIMNNTYASIESLLKNITS